MRKQACCFWNRMLLLCLVLLAGCGTVPEPKTMLLPEEDVEQGVALQGEEGDRYAVRKMYSKDYKGLRFGGFTAFLSGTGEHRVRLAENGSDGLWMQTLDYRYGFYDRGPFPVGELLVSLNLMVSWDYNDGQKLETAFFSPDGKYLLYMRGDLSYTGMRLYMMDLETGKEELLLDGDALQCPGDQFLILAAWSRDASLLCYGFYPRQQSVWDSYKEDHFMLYYRDMETGKIVSRLNYYDAGTAERSRDLQQTRIYVERDGKDIFTVFVSEPEEGEKDEQMRTVFFSQKISGPGEKKEDPDTSGTAGYCPKDTKFYPDAAGGMLYFTSREEGILGLYAEGGACMSRLLLKPAQEIQDFLVLDGGGVFVTAEYDPGDKEGIRHQDICLYLVTKEGASRRVLYQDAGCVIRLQYDPVYRRLLAETGEPDPSEETDYGASAADVRWTENRRALVLEF